MATSQNHNTDTSNDKNTTTTTTTTKPERQQINNILTEFGLDPSDYLFNSSQATSADYPSAFSKYPAQPSLSIISGRPLSYVQHPPPPPPVVNRQASRTQSGDEMNKPGASPRRTPPPIPRYDATTNDPSVSAEHYLHQMDAFDNPPVKVVKPSTQNVVYKKEIRIRYLQPPTPPPPAPIIIRETQLPPIPPESPLLIRERKPEALTPPPLTIRERPPTPPAPVEPCIIDKPIPPPPPPPRQIIIERLPTPPPKPRTVIFEKWLPYKKVKRPILLQKAPPIPPRNPARNVIIEYEPLKAYTVRRVIEEGVFRVDPHQYIDYNRQHSDGDVRIVDRIDDLPPPSEELMRVLQDYNRGSTSNADQLSNIIHSANTPINRQERVLSPAARKTSTPLSSFEPAPRTQSKTSTPAASQRHTPADSPLDLKAEDVY
ncbi:unnamed protein product [Adineta steineri]|uniref:Uncharacterized protein n=1 Tax=Adineta steineri TaxID=433720 RepID=A0A813X3J1_9BILA|nr:unnamed protein product [Adineta steineri]CAF3682205.1 unnamed protein product [Adineta steineri]